MREIDEILAIEGVRIVMLAMTDLSKALGHPFQYEHPEVWEALDSIVKKADARTTRKHSSMRSASSIHIGAALNSE